MSKDVKRPECGGVSFDLAVLFFHCFVVPEAKEKGSSSGSLLCQSEACWVSFLLSHSQREKPFGNKPWASSTLDDHQRFLAFFWKKKMVESFQKGNHS